MFVYVSVQITTGSVAYSTDSGLYSGVRSDDYLGQATTFNAQDEDSHLTGPMTIHTRGKKVRTLRVFTWHLLDGIHVEAMYYWSKVCGQYLGVFKSLYSAGGRGDLFCGFVGVVVCVFVHVFVWV